MLLKMGWVALDGANKMSTPTQTHIYLSTNPHLLWRRLVPMGEHCIPEWASIGLVCGMDWEVISM